MTPAGLCPRCGLGQLTPLPETTGWARCRVCVTTFDRWGNPYDCQGRLRDAREGV